MRRLLAVMACFLLLVFPAAVFAKSGRSKIAIKGVDLKTPIEITDPKTLANSDVGTGPGTSWTGTSPKQPDHFIIDWSQSSPSPQRHFNATKFLSTRNCRMSDSSL